MIDFNPEKIQGVIVPILSPFDDNESIDEKSFRALINHLIQGKVDGIFVLGTSGEFPRLIDAEKWRAAKIVVDEVSGRVPIYIGISDTGTKKAMDNLKIAQELNIDCIVTSLPFYFPVVSIEEQKAYFESIISSSKKPIILYNIPSATQSQISLNVIHDLTKYQNVVGIKDSSGDLAYLEDLINLKTYKHDFKVFIGSEEIMRQGLSMGADGVVPSLGNVFPKMLKAFYQSCIEKDNDYINYLVQKLQALDSLNLSVNSYLAPVSLRKRALSLMGLCNDYVSKPCAYIDKNIDGEIINLIKEYRNEF